MPGSHRLISGVSNDSDCADRVVGPFSFDCSGLVQAAYEVAGISLPRGAQDQYDAEPKLGAGNPIRPGDLLFFGSGPTDIKHVGIYIGNGQMVDRCPPRRLRRPRGADPHDPGISLGE